MSFLFVVGVVVIYGLNRFVTRPYTSNAAEEVAESQIKATIEKNKTQESSTKEQQANKQEEQEKQEKQKDVKLPTGEATDWNLLLVSPTHPLEVDFSEENFVKVFSSDILENYIINKRWYGGKASTLKYIEIVESFQISSKKHTYYGVLFEVNFKEAFYQHYFMPFSFMSEVDLETNTVIAPVIMNGVQGYLVDALHQEDFRKLLFDNIVHSNSKLDAKLNFHCGTKLTQKTYQSSKFMGVEQSNTSIIYNDTLVLKIFRRIYINMNPAYEISRVLTGRMLFGISPA